MFAPLKNRSDFSLLLSTFRPEQIVERCSELGYGAAALTDYGNLAGCVKFIKACKSKKIKPIVGCDFYVDLGGQHGEFAHLTILSKNAKGWSNLLYLVGESNKRYSKRPILCMTDLVGKTDGLIAYSGSLGTILAQSLFKTTQNLIWEDNYEDTKSWLKSGYIDVGLQKINELTALFGKENLFLEVSLMDGDAVQSSKLVGEIIRELGAKSGIPCIAVADAHYSAPQDAPDQRVLLCSLLKTNLRKLSDKVNSSDELGLSRFLKCNRYYLPNKEELEAIYTKEELENTVRLAEMCEPPDILDKLLLPKFECPDNKTPDQYLKELCREGWKKKIVPILKSNEQKQQYGDRAKEELETLTEFGLSSYFLIVQDYVGYAKKNKWLCSPGRGSVGGSLLAYLLDITNLDPIPYNLIFSRFINRGRLSKDHISLPDIDCDFPISKRERIIEYIRDKYSRANVAQISTFSRMQGRSALKDVLNAHEACTFDEMNRITEHIPDESKIMDDLQEMEEEDGDSSIIKWALENNAEKLREWAYIDEKGEIQSDNGNFGNLFAQAIRLEGIKRGQGKHAAGLLICPIPLVGVVPMVYDKSSDELICGLEFKDAENIGLTKVDVLGIAALDKLMGVTDLLTTGKLSGE